MKHSVVSSDSTNPGWSIVLIEHVKDHRMAAAGLVMAGAMVLYLIAQGVYVSLVGQAGGGLQWALLGGTAGFLATALGAVPALGLRHIPQSVEDSMLGFAAGMMLAASAFSLILPALDAGEAMTGHAFSGSLLVVAGMGLGVLLMLGLDAFLPHEHDSTGPCGAGHERCARVWLFVFAIALHNLPEGMAVGVSFAREDFAVGLPLATAIALQDIPEGLAVALSLRAAGLRPWGAVGVAAASGLLEPVGALVGLSLASGLEAAYPIGLGLAAGAMIFVVSHEVIPETHRHGHQTRATLGLMTGFALMMVLDTGLG